VAGAAPAAEQDPPVRRLSSTGRGWRAATLTGLVLLSLYGSLRGTDDLWPFGPMTQFAFYVGPDSEIRSLRVDALTTDGEVVPVPLHANGVGVARAEIEGQLTQIIKDPSLLQSIAVAQRRLHPDEPQYRRLWVREEVTTLRDGRAAGVHDETRAIWDVPDAP
jgi:hypothetical protein